MRIHDSLIAFAFLILGGAVVIATQDLSPAPGQPIGPTMFPTIAGVILAGSSIGLIVRSLHSAERRSWIEIPEHSWRPRNLLSLVLTAASVAFYIWTVEAIGFIACAFIILIVLLIAYGTRPSVALAAAVVLPVVIYVIFARVLGVPLPVVFVEPWI